jgi:hypothetical protein
MAEENAASTILIDETKAADGSSRYPAVTQLTDLIFMLNDGQFNADCAEKLKTFAADLEERGIEDGKKVKGKITLTIEVDREHDGVYFFTPDIKLATPREKHGRTIGWVTPENRFTPNKPNQGNLFGTVRDVTPTRTVRDV